MGQGWEHIERRPGDRPLFSNDAPVRDELRRMIDWARCLLDQDEDPDDPLEWVVEDLWGLANEAAMPLVEHIRAGEAPPVALEVLAGLAGILCPHDHYAQRLWDAAWALARPTPEADEPPPPFRGPGAKLLRERAEAARAERIAEIAAHEESIKQYAGERESLLEALRLGRITRDRVGVDCGGRMRPGLGALPGGPAEHLAAAFRVAPMGAEGVERDDAARARPSLAHYRTLGLSWDALTAAIDAVGGAGFAGYERLHELADAHPDSLPVAWLDEVASWVAGDDDRSDDAWMRVDELLALPAMGKNAMLLAREVDEGRRTRDEHREAIRDAWVQLGSSRTGHKASDATISPTARAVLRRKAHAGDPLAAQFFSIEAMHAQFQEAERREREQEGPFYRLFPPSEIDKTMDLVMRVLVVGFRECLGLELLRDGLPRLEAWMANDERR